VWQAAKRNGLPYQNRLLQDDLLDLCCRYGEGTLAVTYLKQELRYRGWALPSNWSEFSDLVTAHGFKLVCDRETRKYAYYLTM
jgi:hypothetical protein